MIKGTFQGSLLIPLKRQVYRQEIGEPSPTGNFLDAADISSSGKAVVFSDSRSNS